MLDDLGVLLWLEKAPYVLYIVHYLQCLSTTIKQHHGDQQLMWTMMVYTSRGDSQSHLAHVSKELWEDPWECCGPINGDPLWKLWTWRAHAGADTPDTDITFQEWPCQHTSPKWSSAWEPPFFTDGEFNAASDAKYWVVCWISHDSCANTCCASAQSATSIMDQWYSPNIIS